MTVFEWLMVLLIGGSLFVHRLGVMLTREECPNQVCAKLRTWAGVKLVTYPARDAFGNTYEATKTTADSFLGQVLNCFYCTSIWLSMPPALLFVYVLTPVNALVGVLIWIMGVFALSGAATIWYALAKFA